MFVGGGCFVFVCLCFVGVFFVCFLLFVVLWGN